ncbi:MAG: endolytic transglycosylase MltG [Acidobacteriota bacterium]
MKRLVAAAALAAVLGFFARAWILAPHRGFNEPVFVEIPKGAGTFRIGSMLAQNGVIQSPLQLLIVRALRPKVTLQAGEYQFKQAASVWEVYDRIAHGDIFYYSLVVPEGNNTFDIAASLERQGIMDSSEFLKAAHDPSQVADLDPRAPSLEGYLFPDTYRVTRHTTPAQLCRQMTARFRKAWQELGAAAANPHDTVTLASLVEKEAKLPGERPLIASVFVNRMKIGMPLQCDPTTIYAALLEERYRGTIYRSDLESKHLYNTYQHAGLPPGPIANPGIASLRAAAAPPSSDYLYFVARADGSGGHQFSKALAQHTLAVQQYRRGLRQAEQTNGVAHLHRAAPARKNLRNRIR